MSRAPSLLALLVSHWTLSWALTAYGLLAIAAYAWGVSRSRRSWPAHRTLCFAAGVGLIWVALESGLDAYDASLLSVHMVQHLILLVLAPVMLLLGEPLTLALRALPGGGRRRLGSLMGGPRRYMHPLVLLGFYYAVVLGTHVPGFYGATLQHPLLHDTEHALYLLAGLLLWWPVLGSDPAPSRRLNGFLQLVYVIVAMLPMEAIGAFLSRDTTLLYPAYGAPGRMLGVSPLVDQANAGAIMWVWGGVVMVAVVLWSSMQAMVQEERRHQARERHQPAAAILPSPYDRPDRSL